MPQETTLKLPERFDHNFSFWENTKNLTGHFKNQMKPKRNDTPKQRLEYDELFFHQ